MSYTYLREQGEESLAECSSDIPQFALWKLNPTAEKSSCNANATESCHDSPSGMTFEPSTVNPGAASLTACVAASPARTFHAPEKAPDSMERAAGFGENSPAWFAKWDRVSCSWKTPQCSLLAGLDEFSATWPRWGTMRAGVCWELTTPALPTEGSESGYWPTPTVECATGGQVCRGGKRSGELLLSGAVKMWPTPLATDGVHGGPNQRGSKGDLRLSSAVHMFPTPQARDHFPPHNPEYIAGKRAQGHGMSNLNDVIAGNDPNRPAYATPTARDWRRWKASPETMEKNSRPLSEQVGGSLNPDWVEWLMGWPIGWTDCAPLAMDRFQKWLDSHGRR